MAGCAIKILTVTAKGQVTLRQELLRHLGVQPGQQIEVITLPGGTIEVCAAQPPGSIEAFIGRLVDRSPKVASIAAIQALMAAVNVKVDRAAVEAGLSQLEAGGDFTDAVIAHQGQGLGGHTFVSFDRQAVALLQQRDIAAELLG